MLIKHGEDGKGEGSGLWASPSKIVFALWMFGVMMLVNLSTLVSSKQIRA